MPNFSLKSRILVAGAATIVVVVGAMSIVHYRHTKEQLERLYVDRARSLLLTAEAAREETSRQWNGGLFDEQLVTELARQGRVEELLDATPIIVAWRTAQDVGKRDGFEVRLPALRHRNPDNAPDEIDRQVLEKLQQGDLEEYVILDKDRLRYYRPVRVTQECLYCHGDPAYSSRFWNNDRGLDPTGTPMEGFQVGQIRGALVVEQSLAPEKAAMLASLRDDLLFGGILALLCIGVLLWLIDRGGIRPLGRAVDRIAESAARLSDSSTEVAASGQELAESASSQAANLQEVTAELQEIAAQVTSNTKRADAARQVAAEAVAATREGRSAVGEMTGAMDEIKSATDQTGIIIKTIDEIAFQTNLLALNAAVEAARAGEAGRGFAVVADEVRKLAQDSARAAQESARLLEEVRVKTDNGVATTRIVEHSLAGINTVIERIDEVLQEVATVGREQSEGINQISKSIQRIDQLTQGNAATAQQAAAASEILKEQVQELKDVVRELSWIIGKEIRGGELGRKKTPVRKARNRPTTPAVDVSPAERPAAPAGTTATAASLPDDVAADEVFHLEEEDLIEI